MCLGIPGRIAEVWDENGAKMARVEFPSETKKVCLAYLPDLQVGDYTIIHAGFALTKLDEETARNTLELMTQYDVLGWTPTESTGGPR